MILTKAKELLQPTTQKRRGSKIDRNMENILKNFGSGNNLAETNCCCTPASLLRCLCLFGLCLWSHLIKGTSHVSLVAPIPVSDSHFDIGGYKNGFEKSVFSMAEDCEGHSKSVSY